MSLFFLIRTYRADLVMGMDRTKLRRAMTVMSLLFVLVPSMIGSAGFLIIPSGAMAIGIAWLLFRYDQKKESK